MRRLPVVLHVVYKNDWSSAFLPGCACVHLPTMTPRVKPPHTLVSVLHWLWYCRATALSALANLTLLIGKNTLPFPAFGNLNFVPPPHRRAYTSIPKSCPNIRFTYQQDFFPIKSVTKSSTARFSHENLVEKFKVFVQDFVPIRTALTTRQPMVEFYLLTFPRFPLRKKDDKSYFGKNRTHDFRTSRCTGYLLDHSGDEWSSR